MTTLADRYAAGATAHELVLRLVHHDIGLSCTCLAVPQAGRPAWTFIDIRCRFPAAEAIAAYRAWHAARGVEVVLRRLTRAPRSPRPERRHPR